MRITIFFVAMGFLAAGCGVTDPAPTPPPAEPTLAAAGQRFDPPVEASELPAGAWICDMGTVHYAASEKQDGKCPVCGMALIQKPEPGP